jgi:hypothetical protein
VEQIQKAPVRYRRSRQEIQDLLDLFAKGNSGVKDFCKQHNISAANFHKWKSRYRTFSNDNAAAGFATLDVLPSLSSASLFAEVKGIRIYQVVSASFLKELLA